MSSASKNRITIMIKQRKKLDGTPRVMLTGRVAPLVKDIIHAEKAEEESEAAYLERVVLTNVKTQKGKELLARHLKMDTTLTACMNALGIKLPFSVPMTYAN